MLSFVDKRYFVEQGLTLKTAVAIKAPRTKIWEALTKSEWTEQYMFGCAVISNWQINNPIIYKHIPTGVVYVEGTIQQLVPHKLLAFTAFDPNAVIPDDPDKYIVIAITLMDEDDHTLLSITQGDYAHVNDGEKRFHDAMTGWETALGKLKQILEKH